VNGAAIGGRGPVGGGTLAGQVWKESEYVPVLGTGSVTFNFMTRVEPTREWLMVLQGRDSDGTCCGGWGCLLTKQFAEGGGRGAGGSVQERLSRISGHDSR
jgi:hypothetical protein